MKTFFKIALTLCLVCVGLIVAAYFVVTNPSIQTKFIVGQLPEGITLEKIQITLRVIKLEKLSLQQPDAAPIEIGNFEAKYSITEVLFSKNVHLSKLFIDELHIDGRPSNQSSEELADQTPPAPLQIVVNEALNQLHELRYPITIDTLEINGRYTVADDLETPFKLSATNIVPGAGSKIQLHLPAQNYSALPETISTAELKAVLAFTQAENGSLSADQLKLAIDLGDPKELKRIQITSTQNLNFDPASKTTTLNSTYALQTAQPESLYAQLRALKSLQLTATHQIALDTEGATLYPVEFALKLDDAPILSISPKEPIDLNKFPTSLQLDTRVESLQWLSSLMPTGDSISSEPIQTSLLIGRSDTSFSFKPIAPLVISGLNYTRGQETLLKDLQLTISPDIVQLPDGSFYIQLTQLELRDTFGTLFDLNGSATFGEAENATSAQLNYLFPSPRIFDQAIFTQKPALLSGQIKGQLTYNPTTNMPFAFDGSLSQLRTTDRQRVSDFNWQIALQPDASQGSNFRIQSSIGSISKPSTSLTAKGSFRSEANTQHINATIESEQILQSDLNGLIAALSPRSNEAPEKQPAPTTPSPETPFWEGFEADIETRIDKLVLENGIELTQISARFISRADKLSIESLKANAGGGQFSGQMQLNYLESADKPYSIQTLTQIQDVYPNLLVGRRNQLPVQGPFDAELKLNGQGSSPYEAFNQAYGHIDLSAQSGLITAFELDSKKQLGLAGAQLGSIALSKLFDNDNIEKTTQAFTNTLPYFQNIPYDNLKIRFSREKDADVTIENFDVDSEFLRIQATGKIETKSFENLINDPFQLKLQLSAKDYLAKQLDVLSLLKTEATSDGYRPWVETIEIGGTLKKPDTSKITQLLYKAVETSLSKKKTSSNTNTETNTQNEPPKNKREERIEQGLKLLESFGL